MRRRLVLTLLLGAAALPALPTLAQSEPPQVIWSGEDLVFFSRPKGPKPTPPPAPGRIEHVIQRFPSGQVQFDGYELGKVKVGVWTEFDRSGNVLSETPYVRGVLHGEVIRYHSTCANKSNPPPAAERTHYHLNIKDGPHTEYACAGGKAVEGQHVDGQKHGVWRWYSEGKDGPVVAKQASFRCKKCDVAPAPAESAEARAEATRAFLKQSCTPAPVQSMAAAPNIFDCDAQGLIEWKSRLRCRDVSGQRVCALRTR